MKTLGFLLLLAVGLGAAYWTTQRPGEGLEALRDEGRVVVERLSGTAYALRDTVYPALPDIPPADVSPADTLPTDIALTDAAQPDVPRATASVDEALDERIAVLENGLTRTMSVAESSAVQDRLDALEAQLDTLAAPPAPDDGVAGGAGAAGTADGTGMLARIEAIDDRLLELADNDARIERTLARLEGSLAAAGEQPADPDTEVAGGADATGRLDASADATRQRVQELESRLDGLPASAGTDQQARRTQDALERQVAALEQRIVMLGERSDPALVSSIEAVREQVDRLSASGFVTQEELRSRTDGTHVEYKIYFDKNATSVSDAAARVLDSFIAQETNRTTGVAIYGFTDRQGSAVYNQQLAQQRASSVRSYLVQNGFDYTRIDNVAGLGEDAAAVLLEDEQEDAQQRVVVLFASQP